MFFRRRWFKNLAFISIIFILGVAYGSEIASNCASWYLKKLCAEHLKGNFYAESFSWHGGNFQIANVKIQTAFSDIDASHPGVEITIPKVGVALIPSWSKGHLKFALSMQEPTLFLRSEGGKWLQELSMPDLQDSLFPLAYSLKSVDGMIVSVSEERLPFSVDIDIENGLQGHIDLHINKSLGNVVVKINSDSGVELNFDKTDLGFMHRFFFEFMPFGKRYLLTKGYASGSMFLSKNDSSIADSGSVLVTDSVLKDIHTNTEMAFPDVNFVTRNEFNIYNGNYLENYTHLSFDEIDASALISERGITFRKIKTSCCHIHMEGAVEIVYDSSEGIDVSIQCDQASGDVDGLRRFMSHFAYLKPIAELPCKGDFALRSKGAHVDLFFRESGPRSNFNIEGSLSNLHSDVRVGGACLSDFEGDFQYQQNRGTIKLSNITGRMAIDGVEPYLISDAEACLKPSQSECDFMLTLQQQGQKLLSARGQAAQSVQGMRVSCDNFTPYVHGISPDSIDLLLSPTNEVDSFSIACKIDIDAMKSTQVQVRNYGIFDLCGFKACDYDSIARAFGCSSGLYEWTLKYANSKYTYGLESQNCTIGSIPFGMCSLKGTKLGSLWMLDRCQLDDLSISLEMCQENNQCVLNVLNASLGSALQLALDGVYTSEDGRFEGSISHFQGDIKKICELGFIDHQFDKFHPSGVIKAKGKLALRADECCFFDGGEGTLVGSVIAPEFMGLACKDIQKFECQWVSKEKISVHKLKACLKETQKDHPLGNHCSELVSASVENLEWNIRKSQFQIEDLQFDMHPEHISALATKLHYLFPCRIDKNLSNLILNSKNDSFIKGKLNLRTSPEDEDLRIELANDTYIWQGTPYEINNFALESGLSGLKVVFNTKFKDRFLWCFLHANAFMSQGLLAISEHSFRDGLMLQDPDLIRVDWKSDSSTGFSIDKIEGGISGVEILLTRDQTIHATPESIPLLGRISLDLEKCPKLFSSHVHESLEKWGVSGRYQFGGKWDFKKENWGNEANNTTFKGNIKGQNVRWNGLAFADLLAKVEYNLESVRINDLSIRDEAGCLEMPEGILARKEHGMEFSAENVTIKDLRPVLLRGESIPPATSSGCVMNVEFQGVNGDIADARTFRSKGTMTFTYALPKKSLWQQLFILPTEILHRIGLNLNVLTPYCGKILFDLTQGRFQLNRFKGVYSQGKLSKFYLDKRLSDSYVDFDGNIDLRIRMRQNNLLLKLAELFTIHVSGSVHQPVYSLK